MELGLRAFSKYSQIVARFCLFFATYVVMLVFLFVFLYTYGAIIAYRPLLARETLPTSDRETLPIAHCSPGKDCLPATGKHGT